MSEVTFESIRRNLIIDTSILTHELFSDIKDTLKNHKMTDTILELKNIYHNNVTKKDYPDYYFIGCVEAEPHRIKLYYDRVGYRLVVECLPNRKLSENGFVFYSYDDIKNMTTSEFYELLKNDLANSVFAEYKHLFCQHKMTEAEALSNYNRDKWNM